MNAAEAKNILLLYRPGTADADDPQIAAALAFAKTDPQLARWLEEHCARQEALRAKFREIIAPAGLREQIISEHAVLDRMILRRKNVAVASLAVAAIFISLGVLAWMWLPRHPDHNTFANYKNQMVYFAEAGYSMNLTTNQLPAIRDYFAKNSAPADYSLPAPLAKTAVAGCTIQNWNGKSVSMICFRTGKPLPQNQAGDLWLFVADRAAVKNAPDSTAPRFFQADKIAEAIWTRDGKLYLLATEGDEQTLRKYL